MSERRDEKWLDDELRRAINTTAPQFDAQAWKKRFASEYRELQARGERAAEAPWRMVTTISLLAAFVRGGEEAMDRQLDAALEVLGPCPDRLSTRHLLDDLECWHVEGV